MPNFSTLKAPATGTAITRKNGRLVGPDAPIIPYIECDGTGPDIWRASVRVFDAAVAKAYGGSRKIAWMEVYAGEKRAKQVAKWLADRHLETLSETVRELSAGRHHRSLPRILRRHQGAVDDAGRRRHPLAERRVAPVARPLRLSAPGALVSWRALTGQAPRESRHGDLPGEHGRHLRRHRVRRRIP